MQDDGANFQKGKLVADGIFKAQVNELLTEEVAEDGYSGAEVRVTGTGTEIMISATRMRSFWGKGLVGWWT